MRSPELWSSVRLEGGFEEEILDEGSEKEFLRPRDGRSRSLNLYEGGGAPRRGSSSRSSRWVIEIGKAPRLPRRSREGLLGLLPEDMIIL